MSEEEGLAGEALIAFRDVAKSFGGVRALKGVSVDLRKGEILALLGENGAGKSTLIKLLAGIFEPTSGDIAYRGQPYRHRPPKFGERQPVAFIHQDLGLIEWMTIAENIGLATGYPRRVRDCRLGRGRRSDRGARWRKSIAISTRRRACANSSRTEKSLVAIARALSVEADVLVLDEPSASLPADEVHRLFDALRPLKARGVGMIYVSHRLDEVFEIADRITVLRDGLVVGERNGRGDQPGGARLADRRQGARPLRGRACAEGRASAARRAQRRGRGRRPGQLRNQAGRDRRARRACAARARSASGARCSAPCPSRARLSARWRARRPSDALPRRWRPASALSRATAIEESAATGLSIRENTFLNPPAIGRGPFSLLSPRREAERAREIGARVGLRPNDPELPIEALSGGNQQKVIVGRWLEIARRAADRRGPDGRRRRRRQGGDLSAARSRAEGRARHRRRLHRFRGGRATLPSRARLLARPHRRRDRRTPISPSKNSFMRPPSPRLPPPEEIVMASSIKSTALEPTRSELAGLSFGATSAPPRARLRPGHPHRVARAAVQRAVARHVPDAAQSALDHRRQIDHRDPLARRDDPDGDRQDRPDRRLRHRAVAHSRDQPANQSSAFPGRSRSSPCLCWAAASASSMACWSRSRRSTPSSRRSAPARSSMRSRCGTARAGRSLASRPMASTR